MSECLMKKYVRGRPTVLKEEKGQSIVILAFAMVMLLAFVGLTIDVGRLYGTRIQLSRAADAAALAGALELPDEAAAEARARQFMRTNGIDPDEADMAIATGGSVAIGKSNFLTVTAKLPMETMFMRFVGWETVDVPAMAVAEFKSPIEVYASQNTESGVAGVVNLNIFGQDGNTIYGDAFSPLKSSEKPGQSCSCSSPCSNDDWRVMLQGRNSSPGVYPFRIHVPADYEDRNETSLIQVEILDPDSCNDDANSVLVTRLNGDQVWRDADSPSQSSTAMADTGDAQNPKWFVRMDQNLGFCGNSGYKDSEAVETEYTLYYYKLNDRRPYEIAQYRVRTDCNTDLEWVIPGVTPGVGTESGSFRFDLRDYPDVAADENGNRSFYLDVEGIHGPGGNGYDLWAGPPPTDTVVINTTNVNERNVYLINELNEDRNPHSSGGVVVWAMGFLPLNVNTDTTYTITLGYIPPEAAGTRIRVSNFDLDRDTDSLGPGPTGCDCNETPPGGVKHHCFGQHLHYLLEGVPSFYEDGDVSCSSNFGGEEDVLQIPPEFYGGYLYAVFQTLRNDTTDWMLEYLDVVGNTYVRLVK